MQRLKDGFSLGEVSSVGGHADLQTTMNSYAKDSAEKLSEIVKGKKVQGQFIRIAGEEVLERKGRKWSGREDLNICPFQNSCLKFKELQASQNPVINSFINRGRFLRPYETCGGHDK